MWAQNAYRYALLLLRAKGVKLAEIFYWSSPIHFVFVHGDCSPDQTTLEGSSGTSIMTCTGGSGFSF